MRRGDATRGRSRGLTIVKLGGSLLETGRLRDAIELVAAATRPVVLVPGGGPFADAVRAWQQPASLDDAACHRMALLAMHQMGVAMASLHARLATAETVAAIGALLRAGRIPVWLPLRLVEGDPAIPQDWSITSDGLAAWLGDRLRAATIVLVKSRSAERTMSAAEMFRTGLVDRYFAEAARDSQWSHRLVCLDDPADDAWLKERLCVAQPVDGELRESMPELLG